VDISYQISILQNKIRQNEQRIDSLRREIDHIEVTIQGLYDAKNENGNRHSAFQDKIIRERNRLNHVVSASKLRIAQGYARHLSWGNGAATSFTNTDTSAASQFQE